MAGEVTSNWRKPSPQLVGAVILVVGAGIAAVTNAVSADAVPDPSVPAQGTSVVIIGSDPPSFVEQPNAEPADQ